MSHIHSHLRQAVRQLRKDPAFTLLCVLTLAVGIGANTAIFSLVNGVLLSPLPYPDSDRLVSLLHTAPGLELEELPQSQATYLLYKEGCRVCRQVALYQKVRVNLAAPGEPERLPAARVSASLFPALGVPTVLGRSFREEEERPGAEAVAVLSHGLWQRRFGGGPEALGKTFEVDGETAVIIGVMPAGFAFPDPETELWLPIEIDPATADLGSFSPSGLARLEARVSPAAAQAEINRLLRNLEAAFPDSNAAPVLAASGFAARLRPLRDEVVGDVGPTLWVLLAAVGCILLIACANVANLLLVRHERRRRATAVRSALGASRRRLMVAALVESLVLAAVGGAAGLLLALGGLDLLRTLDPGNLPRLAEVAIDARVLAFTAAVALLASLLFGLYPAWRATRAVEMLTVLKGGGEAVSIGRSRRRARRLLVAGQIALALVLLTVSGLMVRSFLQLARMDPGFDAEGVLTFQLALPEVDSPDDRATAQLFQRLLERLRALPGVEAAGASSNLPLTGSAEAGGHAIESHPTPEGAPPPVIQYEMVSEGIFRAMGIPLLAGRPLERADVEQRTGAAVVNQALAERYWPGESALGKRLRLTSVTESEDPWYTVVGVVGNVRSRFLRDELRPIVYYPLLAKSEGDWVPRQMTVAVRTRGAPEFLVQPIRRELAALAPHLPMARVETMEQLMARDRARIRFTVLMLLIATAVALILAAVGTFGVVSYLVAERTPEIGVRMAMGAGRGEIRQLVLKEGLIMAAGGIAVGLAGAGLVTRWLGSLLFQVDPLDPATFAAVPLLLLAVVFLASTAPANRAAALEPRTALLWRL